MGKRNQVNVYAKREEELANALLNAGKPKEENTEIQDADNIVQNIEEIKSELAVEKTNEETEVKLVEVIKQEPVKTTLEEKPSESQDLFTIKKKIKIKKGQKNLTLKEENIEALTNFARKYGFNENEVVDYLIENYLKLIKIK